MKVKELIELLKTLEQDVDIVVSDGGADKEISISEEWINKDNFITYSKETEDQVLYQYTIDF